MDSSPSLEASIGKVICSDPEKDLFLTKNTFPRPTEIDSPSTTSPSRVPFPDGRLFQRKISQLEQDLTAIDSSRDQMRLDHTKILSSLQSDQRTAFSQISNLQTLIQAKSEKISALETRWEVSTRLILHQRQEAVQLRLQKRALWENSLWLKDEIQRKDEEASVILSRLMSVRSYCEWWTVDPAQILELEKNLTQEQETGTELSKDLKLIQGEHQNLVEDLERHLELFKKETPVASYSDSNNGGKESNVESPSLDEMNNQDGRYAQTNTQRHAPTRSTGIKWSSRQIVHHCHHSKTHLWRGPLTRWVCILFFHSRRVARKVLGWSIAALKIAAKVLEYSIIAYVAGFIAGLILSYLDWLWFMYFHFTLLAWIYNRM